MGNVCHVSREVECSTTDRVASLCHSAELCRGVISSVVYPQPRTGVSAVPAPRGISCSCSAGVLSLASLHGMQCCKFQPMPPNSIVQHNTHVSAYTADTTAVLPLLKGVTIHSCTSQEPQIAPVPALQCSNEHQEPPTRTTHPKAPHVSSIHSSATPCSTQWSVLVPGSTGRLTHSTKLVLCPVVDSTPALDEVLYSGHWYWAAGGS